MAGYIFFSEINDLKILFKLDSHIKRCCKRFRVSYDRKKIKTFSRAYYEIIKNKDSNYIPCYRQNESVEKNELPISRVFKEFLDLKQKNISIPQKLLGQIQEDLEQDVEFYP